VNAQEHATNGIPILVASDGQPYIGCDAAVMLLRAIAGACRTNADDPDVDLTSVAEAIDQEADALAVRAIAHTA
jgi:hypothetical protein